MKIFLLLFLCLFFSGSFAQPIYTIPWATQQPKFVFPIYFEEGGGQKDTLYLGYDSLAIGDGIIDSTSTDSIFGVKEIPIDTTKFYVCWTINLYENLNPLVLKDKVYKANVSKRHTSQDGSHHIPLDASIRLNKGILPLKISWDKSLFNSDSLPFLYNPPAPRAEGRFIINYFPDAQISENGHVNTNYFSFYYTLVTDTTIFNQYALHDSVTISNYFGLPEPVESGALEFIIREWLGTTNAEDRQVSDFIIYPNPFQQNINIKTKGINSGKCLIRIYDILGSIKYSMKSDFDNLINLNLEKLEQGIYIIEISEGNLVHRKILYKI